MKKILLIALCLGFAMTQSIQTKQIEVPVTQDTESIDISAYIDLGEGYYNVEMIYFKELIMGSDFDGMGRIKFISEILNTGKIELETYHYGETSLYYAYQPCMIDAEFSNLFNSSTDNFDYSGTMILHITGLFEDELLPPTGDLNFPSSTL